jgi:hypothetical protein
MDVANGAIGVHGELRGGIDLRRLGYVDEVVRDSALLLHRELVGADVETPVNGGGVAVDDLAAVPLRERQAQRALAGRGRSEDRQNQSVGGWWFVAGGSHVILKNT